MITHAAIENTLLSLGWIHHPHNAILCRPVQTFYGKQYALLSDFTPTRSGTALLSAHFESKGDNVLQTANTRIEHPTTLPADIKAFDTAVLLALASAYSVKVARQSNTLDQLYTAPLSINVTELLSPTNLLFNEEGVLLGFI